MARQAFVDQGLNTAVHFWKPQAGTEILFGLLDSHVPFVCKAESVADEAFGKDNAFPAQDDTHP